MGVLGQQARLVGSKDQSHLLQVGFTRVGGWFPRASISWQEISSLPGCICMAWTSLMGRYSQVGGVVSSCACVCVPVKPTRGYYVTTRGCAIELRSMSLPRSHYIIVGAICLIS